MFTGDVSHVSGSIEETVSWNFRPNSEECAVSIENRLLRTEECQTDGNRRREPQSVEFSSGETDVDPSETPNGAEPN